MNLLFCLHYQVVNRSSGRYFIQQGPTSGANFNCEKLSLTNFSCKSLMDKNSSHFEWLIGVPVSLKFSTKTFFQFFTEHVDAPPGEFVVEVGDDEIERYGQLDLHSDDWLFKNNINIKYMFIMKCIKLYTERKVI